MNIVILTPIKPEYQAVRKHLSNPQTITKENCNYEIGTFNGKHNSFQIIIRQTGPRNATMAIATEKAIQHFKPVVLLLVGIAGGVKDVKIGDVVVGTKAYGYAAGKETENGYVSRPNVLPYSHILLTLAERIDKEDAWQKRIQLNNVSSFQPIVYFAPIASDDKVIASTDSNSYKILKQYYNDTAALEMEAIGFAEAVMQHPTVQALNIRSISDLLKNKAASDKEGSQELAAAIATAFAFELLYQLDLSTLNIPSMELKELTKTIQQYIQPNLQNLVDSTSTLPNNPQQKLLWEKIAPLISYEIEELKADPKDEDVLNGIPNQIKKALKSNEALQQELTAIIQQLQQTEEAKGTTITNSKNVIANSTINTSGDFHLGDNNTTTNYKDVGEVTNIKENSGTINLDKSTTHIGQQHNTPNNTGTIHIGDIINIQQVLEQSPTSLSTPEQQALKNQLQTLISTNKIKQALELILKLSKNKDSDIQTQALMLSNRWNSLQKEINGGIISNENANISRNRIISAMLNFIEEL